MGASTRVERRKRNLPTQGYRKATERDSRQPGPPTLSRFTISLTLEEGNGLGCVRFWGSGLVRLLEVESRGDSTCGRVLVSAGPGPRPLLPTDVAAAVRRTSAALPEHHHHTLVMRLWWRDMCRNTTTTPWSQNTTTTPWSGGCGGGKCAHLA